MALVLRPQQEEPYTSPLTAPTHLSAARRPAPTRQPRRRTSRYLRSPVGAGGGGAGADRAVAELPAGRAGRTERCVSVSAPVGEAEVCPVAASPLGAGEARMGARDMAGKVSKDCNVIAMSSKTPPQKDTNIGYGVIGHCRNRDSDPKASKGAEQDCHGINRTCSLYQDGDLCHHNALGGMAQSCTYNDDITMLLSQCKRVPGSIYTSSNLDTPVQEDSPVPYQLTPHHPAPPGSHQEDTGVDIEDGDSGMKDDTGHQCHRDLPHNQEPRAVHLCHQASPHPDKPNTTNAHQHGVDPQSSTCTQHLEDLESTRTISPTLRCSPVSQVAALVSCSRWVSSVGGCRGWSRQVMLVVYVFMLMVISGPWRTAEALPVANMHQWNTIGCIWRSSISPTMPREQVFSPRPECLFGQLWWYDALPGYILRVYFRHPTSGSDFRLCLQHHGKGYVTNIHQQKGEMDALLKTPSEGAESCITSERGVIELYFEAPSVSVYVTVIQYVIRDIEPT